MYKSKYTTVETQNASEGLSNGLDKAKERISNPEGMVKDISKIERQRKDQNKQTNRRYKNCGTITKGNIHAFKTITALTSLDSCQTSNQRSRELRTRKTTTAKLQEIKDEVLKEENLYIQKSR